MGDTTATTPNNNITTKIDAAKEEVCVCLCAGMLFLNGNNGPHPNLSCSLYSTTQIAALKTRIHELQRTKRMQLLPQAAASVRAASSGRGPPSVKLRRTLKGHFGKVTALHWSGDSREIVSASQDGNLLVWNPISNNKIQAIQLKSSYVMAVGIEQTKGNLIACGGLDNLCTIYPRNNINNAQEMASHDGFLSCCRFLNEEEILTSSGDSTCIRWDIPTATPVSRFREHTADVMFISIQDRNVFASCSVDLTAKIWDMRTPDAAVQTYQPHILNPGMVNADLNAIEFMPTEKHCFGVCGQDCTVRLYDMRANNEIACFAKDPAKLNQNNNTTTMNYNYNIHNSNNAGMDQETAGGGGGAEGITTDGFTSLSFSKSGRMAFCGDMEGNVWAFDVFQPSETGPAFRLSQAHERHISCLAVSPAGDALCTGSWDATLKIWA
jgi:guanine nucleotide-binding protein G(I)/G(S)/G(T) subunit beta-1